MVSSGGGGSSVVGGGGDVGLEGEMFSLPGDGGRGGGGGAGVVEGGAFRRAQIASTSTVATECVGRALEALSSLQSVRKVCAVTPRCSRASPSTSTP